MKIFFNKIKSKWINMDIKKRNRILVISIIIVFFASSIIVFNNIKANTYRFVTGDSHLYEDRGIGTGGKPIGDAVRNAGQNTYYLEGVGDVFCIEPGIRAETGLMYNEIGYDSIGSVKYSTVSGAKKTVPVTTKMKEYWSLISYYYENHKGEYEPDVLRATSQMLVWEISTGGRTHFNNEDYGPDVYSGPDSYWYEKVSGNHKTYNEHIARAYKDTVTFVRNYYQNPSGLSENEEENRYDLEYNSTTSRYETIINSNADIASYSCSSTNPAVSININGNNITVSSSNFLDNYSTITCTKGSSIGGKFYRYNDDYQIVVKGYFTPEKTIKFQVKTSGFPISIKKKNEYNEDLQGAVFTVSNGEDSYSINGNGDSVIIKKPGVYKIEETTVPEGYKKMPTQNVNITGAQTFTYQDAPLYIKFYKEDSLTGKRINNAGFKIYNGNTALNFIDRDSNGCYTVSSSGPISEVFTNTNINNGEICIKRVSSNVTYTIEESTVPNGYTKMQNTKITAPIKDDNSSVNISQKRLVNYPTMLEFEKKTSDDGNNSDSLITILTDIAKFTITNKNSNTPLKFTYKGNGEYWYDPSGLVTLLNTTNKKFVVKYLPWGDYTVNEVSYTLTNEEKQIIFNLTGMMYGNEQIKGIPGYYYNNDKSSFTISNTTNGVVNSMPSAKTNIINNPVTINFEKQDIYKYYTGSDIEKLDGDKKLFDTAKFVLKDSDGNILSLTKISDGVYDYIKGNNENINEINTYNGKLTIYHLMNNKSYTIEEVQAPEGFILPLEHPKVIYNINDQEPSKEIDSSVTQVIENIPTKIKIQKRDLKTGDLIRDTKEKAKFELYNIKDDGSKERVYVTEKTIMTDAHGNAEFGYRYSKLNEKTNVQITLTNGEIIIRYLPKGNYVLVEVESPEGYDLPVGINAETRFEVSGTTIDTEIEVIKNKPSKIIIKKYSEDGFLITGARFKIYKVINYDENLSEKNQNKELLELKTIRDGEYQYKEVKDTNEVTTCINNCKEIGKETSDDGSIEPGMLMIEYLDTNNYYIIEEVQSPDGYSIPDNPYTLVYLKESVEDEDIIIEVEDKYTLATFYKYDEYNNPLDGAEYKLQKLNSNRIYEDVTVSKIEDREGSSYFVDYNTQNNTITTTNGSATIYMLTEGQYRVIEVKPPEGYELPKASINVSTFFVTSTGDVKGDFIITNKKPTSPNITLNKASSELVISIQTGQTIIRYSIIIISLLIIIVGLIFVNKKMK